MCWQFQVMSSCCLRLPLALTAMAAAVAAAVEEGACHSSAADSAACRSDEDVAMLQHAVPRRPSFDESGSASAQPRDYDQIERMPLEGLAPSLKFGQGGAPVPEEAERPCGAVAYAAKHALPSNAEADGFEPPMVVGSAENMDPRFASLGIDLTGIWWMRGNPIPEELVSFAHTTANESSFPVTLTVNNGGKGMWAWSDTAMGQSLVAFYANYDANVSMTIDFDSATSGSISTALTDVPLLWVEGFLFYYQNDDEWLRPTTFQDRSMFSDTNYTLTRVVRGDGSAHPTYWPLFLQHMTSRPWFGEGVVGEAKMITYTSNSRCMRRCAMVLPCSTCREMC